MRMALLFCFLLFCWVPFTAQAGLVQVGDLSIVEESRDEPDDPYGHRIYYYDMALDAEGRAYVLYARPKEDRVHTDVILAVETPNGWVEAIVTPVSVYRPDAIHLDADDADHFHLTYLQKNGGAQYINDFETEDLMYARLSKAEIHGWIGNQELFHAQVSTRAQPVSLGGWRSQLEVSAAGTPYIVREFENGLCLFTPDTAAAELADSPCSLVYPGWQAQKLELPRMNWSRLGEFHLDAQGGAHLIYGDYAFDRKGQPYTAGDGFQPEPHLEYYHNLWYARASAPQGVWGAMILDENAADSTPTLYNWQFWVDLTSDAEGNPAVTKWLWKPGTQDVQAYDTKSVFFHNNGAGWRAAYATPIFNDVSHYADGPVAGMGPAVLKTAEGWHGVWDSSHSRPYDHTSERGGLMYRFSPDGIDWSTHQILAEFSAEGRVEMQLHDNTLNILVLGDHKDTKLYFMRYQLPEPAHLEVFPGRTFYYRGEPVSLHAKIGAGAVGDFYAAVFSRSRPEINQPGEIWQLLPDYTWQKIVDVQALAPFMSVTPANAAAQVLKLGNVAAMTEPFAQKDTYYDVYTVAAKPGTHVLDLQWLTPLTGHTLFANIALPAGQ